MLKPLVPFVALALVLAGCGTAAEPDDGLIHVVASTNVYGDMPAPSPTVTLEDVVRRDPDVVLTSPEGRTHMLADPRWRAVRAVREGRVLAFDTTVVGRPSVVMGQAAVSIASMDSGGRSPMKRLGMPRRVVPKICRCLQCVMTR